MKNAFFKEFFPEYLEHIKTEIKESSEKTSDIKDNILKFCYKRLAMNE